ncbi:uncharacterized protein V6R79_006114 [Siganus canaliculatus]
MSDSVFNALRLEGAFSDAVIKVEGVDFNVHKVILAKTSPYFRALFTRLSSPDTMLYEIPELSSSAMQLIIQYAYTGSVSVTKDNVRDLVMAADQLCIPDIAQTCCKFLAELLCSDNCISIWHFTDVCFSPELQQKAYHFIVDHFEDVVLGEEFQQLTAQELSDIINRDDLGVKREDVVFEAVIRWVGHATEEREKHLADLLSKVRMAFLKTDYITMNVRCHELVKKNPVCLQMAENIRLLTLHCDLHGSEMRNYFAHPRLPNAILLAIGGWSGDFPTNSIEAYDIHADHWLNVTDPLEHPRAYHGTAFLDGCVYCLGGFDRIEYFNSVRKFVPSTRTWHEVAPMYFRRCFVSVTVLNGCVYAMGGYDGQVRLNSAERYSPGTNQWNLIADMNEVRSDASCTAFNNKIYICGGFNGNECLQTCEYYCPQTDCWTLFTPMNSRRSGLGIIAYADHVYAVGGFDGVDRHCSAEAYNPRTNAWQPVPSMLAGRSNFGIAVINDLLFVVGGFNGYTTTIQVEYYNAETEEWSEASFMESCRSAVSCCVMSGVSNLAEYTVPRESWSLVECESDSDSSD